MMKRLCIIAVLLFSGAVRGSDEDEKTKIAIAIELAKLKAKTTGTVTPTPSSTYDPYHYTYEALYNAILNGQLTRGVLLVGVADKYVNSYQVHAVVASGFGGLADGEYDCFLLNGEPKLQPRKAVSQKATPFPITTPPITAPRVGGLSTPSIASTPMELTTIGATTTGRFGGTNYCPPSG